MTERVYLAVDLGAESGRVMAGTLAEGRVSLEELHRFPNGPVNVAGTRRWDVLRLWSDIQEGLSQAASHFGDQIVSVGVDTWGVDYVLLSAKDEIVGQPYNYRDPRTQGVMEQTFLRVPRDEIFATTGLQFMEINTLYQLIAMQLNDPDLLKVADKFLMMPDFFHWLLSGSRVVEFTNATTTQFFHRDQSGPGRRSCCESSRFRSHMFPEVVLSRHESRQAAGVRRPAVRTGSGSMSSLRRRMTPAPPSPPCRLNIPERPTGPTSVQGTWSLIGVEVQDAILSDAALATQNVTNEGGIDGTYRLLKNVMGLWLVQQCSKRSFERAGKSSTTTSELDPVGRTGSSRSVRWSTRTTAAFLNPDDMAAAMQDYWCRKITASPFPRPTGANRPLRSWSRSRSSTGRSWKGSSR